MKRLLLHVGYPKAASTSLQNGLFLDLHKAKLINFLGRAFESRFFGSRQDRDDYKAWFRNVADGATYDERDALGELSDTVVNVLSEGLFMMNERHSEIVVAPEILHRYFAGRADRIDVLLVVRRQPDLLLSYFTQNYRKLGKKNFAHFLRDNVKGNWRGEAKIFNFHDVACAYAAKFGKDHVHVVLFEDFVRDKERFSSAIGKVMDVDPAVVARHLGSAALNQSRKEAGAIVIRKLNVTSTRHRCIRLLEKLGLPKLADRLRVRIHPAGDDEKQAIFAAFKDSNRRLAEEFGLDRKVMQDYGYF